MKFKWIQSLKPMLFSLLLLSTLADLCPGPGGNGVTPADSTGCGVGAGDYNFYLVNTVPESFNSNDSGSFVITLRPDIDTSYTGPSDLVFNRLYFILKSGYDSVITNYVEFLAEDTLDKQLEWGGSLPTGDYEVRGIMKNIQLNSSCKDSVHRAAYRDLGWIYITEFAYPQKVMEIEYFCQDSDTNIIDRYDVFLSPNTEEYIDIAFNVANTTYDLWTIDTLLPCSLILNTDQAMAEYIYDRRLLDYGMFLCGIKGFRDGKGGFNPNVLGRTSATDTLTFVPSYYSGSLVAVKACIDFSAPEYDVDHNCLVTATTIHELAHQRAVWGHHQWVSGPRFCRMNPTPWYPSGHDTHPHWAGTYSNPHFCETCLNKMKSITW